ncbi:MAG: hypothetical protein RIS94_854 [Pseudomonadota bacterium]|jgi:molybdenum cofactor cytidylyltransferase
MPSPDFSGPEFEDIALVLLAAGRAERFGGGKLQALLAGRPVLTHVADHLATLPFAARFVTGTAALPGYTGLPLDPPDAPQSRSLGLGVAAARDAGARAVLIALGDMPLVPASHFRALVAAFDGNRIASRSGNTSMPPALFGAQHFEALIALSGDRGAGALLRDAPALPLPANAALDIDTPEDLARAEALLTTMGPA